MTTPNAPTGVAAEHLKLEPPLPNGDFDLPWPGLYPTLGQRRTYIAAFMRWYLWLPDFEERQRKLREQAEQYATEIYISHKKEPQSSMEFEALVDWVVWRSWFNGLPEEQRPTWPWHGIVPPRTEDDTGSTKFAELKESWDGKYLFLPEQPISANPATADSVRQQEVINRLRQIEKEYYKRD
ncbi:hypothetical protein NW768_004043 [Fusarium equiseti]|uniref:Uncharacterized protein n=1 Tax=Fusarium equiseti TaxID=61235 RepID=A0ABQ8RJC0_FUSEQ|nr:hypothetical protein NW768_004043 [Fusarium equiseti]